MIPGWTLQGAEKTFLSFPRHACRHTTFLTYRHTCAHCVWTRLVCSHVYAFTHVYTLKHTSLQIHVHTHQIHAHTGIHTHVHKHSHMHIFMRSEMFTHEHLCLHIPVRTREQTPGRICTHIHTPDHAHTNEHTGTKQAHACTRAVHTLKI